MTTYETDLFDAMERAECKGLSDWLCRFVTPINSEPLQLQVSYLLEFLDGKFTIEKDTKGNTVIRSVVPGTSYECTVFANGNAATVKAGRCVTEYPGQIETWNGYASFISEHECVAIWPTNRR